MSFRPDAVLAAARHEGDAAADACLAELGPAASGFNAVMRHAHRNDAAVDGAPAALAAFLAGVKPPAWAESIRIESAQRFAKANLFAVTAALFAASLPSTYAAERGARVLVATGRMRQATLERRINETAQFVLDVLEPGGFGPAGNAVRSIQKVRLVHAAVRVSLRRRPELADEVAINQEDMLGTGMAFSVTVLEGLRAIGVTVEPEVADDFIHLWMVASAMLGVREDLLPRSYAEALSCRRQINGRQNRASEHGRELMRVLLAGMEEHAFGSKALPRWLVRHMLGDGMADLLGVDVTGRMFGGALVGRAMAKTLGLVSPLLGKPLLEAVVAKKLGGGTSSFEMPVAGPVAGASSPDALAGELVYRRDE